MTPAKVRRTDGNEPPAQPTLTPYPIGIAAALAGIELETLRMWERRYGLVVAQRTEGGHRLYSERDVQLIRAAGRLVEAGMRIGVIAKLPHARILAEADKLPVGPARTVAPISQAENVARVIAAAIAFEGERVTELLDAPRLTLDARHVLEDVYLPLMRRLGELWQSEGLPVGVEHFLSKLVTSRLHALLDSIPPPKKRPLVLCACPPQEHHDIGLLAACVDLRAGGVATAFLGSDLPVSELLSAANKMRPAAVLLATTIALPASISAELRAAWKKPALSQVPLVLGGRNAQALARSIGDGVVAVDDILGVAPRIRSLIRRAP